jgi:uncharacterized membrane protein YccC
LQKTFSTELETLRERLLNGLQHAGMSAAAALIAYVPTKALGFQEGFWAAITAIAVVQTEFSAVRSTARDQFIGAAIGGAIGGGVALTFGSHLVTYAAAVVAAIVACWLINIASSARLSGTTATIILLVPHSGSPLSIMLARVSEVAWGVSTGVAVVWLVTKLRPKKSSPASLRVHS